MSSSCKKVAITPAVYSSTNPFSVTMFGKTAVAWSDAKSPGGIHVKIGCQSYSINHWKQHGLAIVYQQVVFGGSALISGADVLGCIRETENATVKALHTMLKQKLGGVSGAQRTAAQRQAQTTKGQLDVALGIVEMCVQAAGHRKTTVTHVDDEEDDD